MCARQLLRWLAPCLLIVGLGGRAEAAPSVPPPNELGPLVTQVRLLTAHPDPRAAKIVSQWVERGLPPPALVAFLEAARRNPDEAYAPVLRRLLRYRRVAIRGRALAALAALGSRHAHHAILIGLDDWDPRMRRLAYELAKVHTNPAVEEAVLQVVQRDPELEADWTRQEGPVVVEVEVEAEDEDEPEEEIVIVEAEAQP